MGVLNGQAVIVKFAADRFPEEWKGDCWLGFEQSGSPHSTRNQRSNPKNGVAQPRCALALRPRLNKGPFQRGTGTDLLAVERCGGFCQAAEQNTALGPIVNNSGPELRTIGLLCDDYQTKSTTTSPRVRG
jgi:hypothetical protein